MDIKHSRRLLLLGAPACGSLDLTHALTGSAPSPDASGSCAGLTHEWDVRTAYYKATVPLWIDEISNVDEWKEEFMKEEAGEVVRAVGAWAYVFRLSPTPNSGEGASEGEVEKTMGALQEVLEAHAGYGAESVLLAVGMPGNGANGTALAKEKREEWDDVAMQYGFEFVEFGAQGVNEFGEKQGVERVREALEANEWADEEGGGEGEDDLGLELGGDEDEFGDFGFGREEAEMTAELFGLKASLLGEGGEDEDGYGEVLGDMEQKNQVDDLDKMMSKLMAVREQSADLPEAQRKRMAVKAVRELMGDGSGI
ncbi:hypothetical protein MBLNU13_g06369t1 [Cladosporium sp. NU13]